MATQSSIVSFDSTPADVMLKDGRHSIIGVIDLYSRRVKLHVSKTSQRELDHRLGRSGPELELFQNDLNAVYAGVEGGAT